MIAGKGWIADPEKVRVVVRLEMTMAELTELRELLSKQPGYWPFGKISSVLLDIAHQVEKTAWSNSPEAPSEP